jgi:rRNA maturation protein Nop10
MKSTEDTTIAEFSPDDNHRVETEKRQESQQRAYLLRCWWERGATAIRKPVWRFSLEEVFGERRRRGFRSLKAVFAFIRGELTGSEGPPSDDGM